MEAYLNVKTDWAVFVSLFLIWTVFVFLDVLFKMNKSQTHNFITLMGMGYIKSVLVPILLWMLYAMKVSEISDHMPWPLNLVF